MPHKPRFHALGPMVLHVSAIYEYGLSEDVHISLIFQYVDT